MALETAWLLLPRTPHPLFQIANELFKWSKQFECLATYDEKQ